MQPSTDLNSVYLRPVQSALADALAKVLSERPLPTDPVHAMGQLLIDRAAEAANSQDAAVAREQALAAAREAARALMNPEDRAYDEAVEYIFANADYSGSAKRYQEPEKNWERFETLLELLGQPYEKLQVVHIAGTNGKGTTSALLDAMIRGSNSGSVGLFTSPHLHSFRERVRVDGQLVSKAAVVTAMKTVQEAVQQLEPDGYASPFEKLTALALLIFVDAGCKWAVMETGLGGRWDCTNHCKPLVCGICRVGFDHMNVSSILLLLFLLSLPPCYSLLTHHSHRRLHAASASASASASAFACRPYVRSCEQVLGDTIGKIAKEKAGILKESIPGFCVPQHPEALPVLENTARQVGTTLEIAESRVDEEVGLPFWLSPRHQRHNAALAFAMMWSLYDQGKLPGLQVEEGTKGAGWSAAAAWRAARDELHWPCRFEVFDGAKVFGDDKSTLVLDVAHNQPAVEALLNAAQVAWPGARVAVIFGANKDKDVKKICVALAKLPTLALLVAVQSSHPKALTTKEILEQRKDSNAAAKAAREAAAAKAKALSGGKEPPAEEPRKEPPWKAAGSMKEALKLAGAAVKQPKGGESKEQDNFWGGGQAASSGPAPGLVICCGSVFVAADMRQDLFDLHPDLFKSSDWVHERMKEPALLM